MKTRGFDTSRVERGSRPRKESSFAACADEDVCNPHPVFIHCGESPFIGVQIAQVHYHANLSPVGTASTNHLSHPCQYSCIPYAVPTELNPIYCMQLPILNVVPMGLHRGFDTATAGAVQTCKVVLAE